MWQYAETFKEKGYVVVPADDRAPLDELRNEIFRRARTIFEHEGEDPAAFFNNFHDLAVTGARLNELRVKLIKEVTDQVESASLVYKTFRTTILELLGPDLLVQKNTNLVIQQPNDPNPSELHRDAPANSAFELVVWLPLVDAYGTKAMYVADRKLTKEALAHVDDTVEGYEAYDAKVKKHAPNIPVPYGSGLFFWPGLLHGSHINAEKETRWVLNIRFKNIFSPNGDKEPFEFFKVFSLSPLAVMATEMQRERDIR